MSLEYLLFGKGGVSLDAHAIMHRDTTPIGRTQATYLNMLKHWVLSDDSPWCLLKFAGVQSLNDNATRASARRQVL
jgi:hypothetical protein